MTTNHTTPVISPAAIEQECEDAPRQTPEDDVAGFVAPAVAAGIAIAASGAGLVVSVGLAAGAAYAAGRAVGTALSQPDAPKIAPGT